MKAPVSATLVYILMPEIYDHAKLDLAGRGDDLDGRDGPERRSVGRCGDLALDQKASSTRMALQDWPAIVRAEMIEHMDTLIGALAGIAAAPLVSRY